MKNLSEHEPDPIPNDYPAIYDLIMEDLKERDKYGEDKYGVRLQPFNGRNASIDAYQEVMDLLVYSKQMIFEFNETNEKNIRLLSTVRQLRDGWAQADKQLSYQQKGIFNALDLLKDGDPVSALLVLEKCIR